jgi:anti-anti-sigma factor
MIPRDARDSGEVMQFLITSHEKNDYLVFYLSGDLNYEGACKLKNAFSDAVDAGGRNFVLNLEGLKIISSHALSTILKLSYMAKKSTGTVAVICPEGNVWDVFYVLELGKVIPIFSSEEAFWSSVSNRTVPAA